MDRQDEWVDRGVRETEWVGGHRDGERMAGDCTRSEDRVMTRSRLVYAVYVEERPGRLAFLGYRDDGMQIPAAA